MTIEHIGVKPIQINLPNTIMSISETIEHIRVNLIQINSPNTIMSI